MFCTECGKQLPDGTRFCPVCGNDLAAASQNAETATPIVQGAAGGEAAADVAPSTNEAATPVVPAASTPAPAPKNTKIVRIAVAAAVVAVVAVLGLGIFVYLQFFSGTPIDEEHFPDKAFCSFVATNLDTDGDGKLSAKEIENVTVVDLSGQSGIADVTGVAVFTNMESFNLGPNTVANVDLSQNTHVTQVSTGTGSTEDLKLPSGFDMQAGLDGAADTKVESGDVTIQAGEWTSDNGGRFGFLQRYNGVLYAGIDHSVRSKQVEFEGATTFFGNTNYFYLTDGKAYWVDNFGGNGSKAVSLYSANIDGSDQKTIAQNVYSPSDFYYVDGIIFFGAAVDQKSVLSYVDTTTGEVAALPDTVSKVKGVYDNQLVVTSSTTSDRLGYSQSIALFNPKTKELNTILSASVGSSDSVTVSNNGILIGKPSDVSLYKIDGTPVWSNKTMFIQTKPYGNDLYNLYADEKNYYRVYEANQETHAFRLDIYDQISLDHSSIEFVVPEIVEQSQSLRRVLLTDSKGAIIELSQFDIDNACLYYVPFNGDAPTCLQKFPVK